MLTSVAMLAIFGIYCELFHSVLMPTPTDEGFFECIVASSAFNDDVIARDLGVES